MLLRSPDLTAQTGVLDRGDGLDGKSLRSKIVPQAQVYEAKM